MYHASLVLGTTSHEKSKLPEGHNANKSGRSKITKMQPTKHVAKLKRQNPHPNPRGDLLEIIKHS